jgi:hypothetical protein
VRVSDQRMCTSDLQLSSVWAMINAGMLWIQLVYAMRSPMLKCSTLLSPASMTEFPLLAPPSHSFLAFSISHGGRAPRSLAADELLERAEPLPARALRARARLATRAELRKERVLIAW